MTHRELIEAVAFDCDITRKLAAQVIEETFDLIAHEAKGAGRVAVPGFGVFLRRRRKARRVVSPVRPGEFHELPVTETIGFRASKKLKRHIGKARRLKWWLSFADGRKPKGQQFLGVCIVEGATFIAAIKAAHILGLNPGGEVQAQELPADSEVHPSWLGVLLDRKTIEQHDTPEGWRAPRPERR